MLVLTITHHERRKKGDESSEVSLLALQPMLAHANLALRLQRSEATPIVSPRKVLIESRRELSGATQPSRPSYHLRLQRCRASCRRHKSSKVAREWPRRRPYKPPAPPNLLTFTVELRAIVMQHFGAV